MSEKQQHTVADTTNNPDPKNLDQKNPDLSVNPTETNSQSLEVASDNVAADAEPEAKIQYPSGLPLFFIVLALILAIFLASLDMVCPQTAAYNLPLLTH